MQKFSCENYYRASYRFKSPESRCIVDNMDARKKLGNSAEDLAVHYLSTKGYHILDRNYQKPWGEIDIIAKKEEILIFVEVKANAKHTSEAFNPEVRADNKKMQKVIKTAMLYLGHKAGGLDHEWRIDVISVTMGEAKAKITHFKNVAEAFN